MNATSSRAAAAAHVQDTGPTTRAVIQQRNGAPDVLTLTRQPMPLPGPGEVVVGVHAASVNARDWHIMRGEPRLRPSPRPGGLRGPSAPCPDPGTDRVLTLPDVWSRHLGLALRYLAGAEDEVVLAEQPTRPGVNRGGMCPSAG